MQKSQSTVNNLRSWSTRHGGYTGLSSSEDESQSSSSIHNVSSASWLIIPNIWFITTIVLLFIIAKQDRGQSVSIQQNTPLDTADYGFERTSSAIKPDQQRFDWAIRDHENGTLYVSYNSSQPQYVGPAGEEVDTAWEKLLHGRYLLLTNSEVAAFNNDKFLPNLTAIEIAPTQDNSDDNTTITPSSQTHQQQTDEPNYYAEPDMYHSLHCLNELRKLQDPNYYESKNHLPIELRRTHVEHCIEQLRQAILCHGDMTPVSLKPVLVAGHVKYFLGQTERLHSCRDWKAVAAWVKQRGQDTGFLDVP